MVFGTAGDSGSDYKIVIEWENGEKALNLSEKKQVSYGASSNLNYTDSNASALVGYV